MLYAGSICSEDHKPGYADFYFRVTRRLESGWVETEYGYLTREFSRWVFKPGSRPVRLNLAQMCSIKIEPLTD